MNTITSLAVALTIGLGAGVGAFALRPAVARSGSGDGALVSTVEYRTQALPAAAVEAPEGKLEPGLARMFHGSQGCRVLVHVTGSDALSHLEHAGFRVGAHHPLARVVEVSARPGDLPSLAVLPCVRRVSAPIPAPAADGGLYFAN